MPGFSTDYVVVIFLIGWGLLIIISFLGAFIRAVLSCIRDLIYGEERTPWTESESEPGELYRAMSRDRKDEIDNLRKIALLKYLSRFTLVRHCCWRLVTIFIFSSGKHLTRLYVSSTIDTWQRRYASPLWTPG